MRERAELSEVRDRPTASAEHLLIQLANFLEKDPQLLLPADYCRLRERGLQARPSSPIANDHLLQQVMP